MTQIAYRFRGDNSPEFTIDILQNYRLFCAEWGALNDPMEGTYDTLLIADEGKRSSAIERIYQEKVKLRICSLSHSYKTHCMWAYYASDYRGVAIEIEFPDGVLRNVDYCSGSRVQSWVDKANPYEIACDILTKKHRDWDREKEARLLHTGQFYQLQPHSIRRVILGSRIGDAFEQKIRRAAGGITVHKLTVRNGTLKAA